MALNPFDKDVSVHQQMGDNPNTDNSLSADAVKAMFDRPAEDIKAYLNNVVVPFVNEVVDKIQETGSCSVTVEDDPSGGGFNLTFDNVKGGAASQERVFLRHGDSSHIDVEETGTGYELTVKNTKGTASEVEKVTLKHGGHYIPVVTQPDANTMQLSYTPSDAGMPAVPPATVELPGGGNDSTQNPTVATVEPAEDDIPKVFITGVKPTTKDDVLAEMQYISKTDNFHAYLTIKCQGTSSMAYAKKNFTVKLYSDEARETKLKKDFKDWNHPGNKFVLKANYIDHSHARNIVSARLWNEVVKSRPDHDTLPEEMRNSPRNGAVDGFPIKVYYNGTYEGIYTWNIGKDDWMWGMDEDNPNHILLCAETNTDGTYKATSCNFRALWSGVDGADWSVEVGTNSDALKTSLNNLIQFVVDNDGDAFRNGIGNYLDIQSAIDYYIFQYEVCGLDGLAKNMLLGTYDGVVWRCGAYDLDSTFGLWWNGSRFVSATYACPEDYQEQFSLLWERIEANYLPELKARQAELRKTVLSYSNMVTHFERFMDVIGLDLYAEDLAIYSAIPSGSTNNIKQIRNYIRDRQAYVDAEFAAMTEPVPCTGISLDTDTLTFTAEGMQTLTATVTPDGCTDAIIWESDNISIAVVSDGIVTPVANGTATITAKCGEYSATCTVSVSGIVESVPCTELTLDKQTLKFDGEGSQALTAVLTPENTTDLLVWSSSNENVATVSDGVVTAAYSGYATITATCGNAKATCTVEVTGLSEFEETNVFEGKAFNTGYINGISGEIVTQTTGTDCYSDKADVSAYTGKTILVSFGSDPGGYGKVAFYDAGDEPVAVSMPSVAHTVYVVPENAAYMRIGAAKNLFTAATVKIGANLFDATNKVSAKYIVPESGVEKPMAGISYVKLPVQPNTLYASNLVRNGCWFDGADGHAGALDTEKTGKGVPAVLSSPESAEFVALNFDNINESGVYFGIPDVLIGEISNNFATE